MSLLDHFHEPIVDECPWDSFHSTWATRIADRLNEQWLSAPFIAFEQTRAGSLMEIDVAAFERAELQTARPKHVSGTALLEPALWNPPEPAMTMPSLIPASFEVGIFNREGGLTLVAAIELISASNKDRPESRRAFATKCASYLYQGISLVIIDIVTSRRANLHNEIMELMSAAEQYKMPNLRGLYAAAYRPVEREERVEIDIWPADLNLGSQLPTLPLRLTGETFVPVEFEASYEEACRKRRLA